MAPVPGVPLITRPVAGELPASSCTAHFPGIRYLDMSYYPGPIVSHKHWANYTFIKQLDQLLNKQTNNRLKVVGG